MRTEVTLKSLQADRLTKNLSSFNRGNLDYRTVSWGYWKLIKDHQLSHYETVFLSVCLKWKKLKAILPCRHLHRRMSDSRSNHNILTRSHICDVQHFVPRVKETQFLSHVWIVYFKSGLIYKKQLNGYNNSNYILSFYF